jgi:hypothetical protein
MSPVLGKRLQSGDSAWGLDARIALALSCGSLLLYGWLMFLWKSHHVFAQDNILFDADPPSRLSQLAHGWGDHTLAHPILPYIFSIPFRMIAAIFLKVHLSNDPVQLREAMAVWVAPVCSAIKVGIAYATGQMIGASRRGSLGLALLAGFSLAPAVFGSVPEHHALSALVLTATFGWATAVRFALIPDRYAVWLTLAFLATGITVTNVVVVLIIYLASRLSGGHEWRRSLAAAALLGILATGTAIGLSMVGARVLKQPAPIESTVTLANSYTQHPNVERGVRYAAALATSLIGPYPGTMQNESALTPRAKSANELNVQFSYDILPMTAWTWTRIALILGVAGVGAWYGWRGDVRFRGLVIAALLVLVYNGVFHLLWGTEWLLYSIHWHSALLMLLAGWLVGSKSNGGRILLMLGIICAADAALVIREMLTVLERVAR